MRTQNCSCCTRFKKESYTFAQSENSPTLVLISKMKNNLKSRWKLVRFPDPPAFGSQALSSVKGMFWKDRMKRFVFSRFCRLMLNTFYFHVSVKVARRWECKIANVAQEWKWTMGWKGRMIGGFVFSLRQRKTCLCATAAADGGGWIFDAIFPVPPPDVPLERGCSFQFLDFSFLIFRFLILRFFLDV